MFDLARTRIRRSWSPVSARTLAASRTTRASAPKAIEPVTRSTGSRPAVPLDRCVMPSTAQRRPGSEIDQRLQSAAHFGRLVRVASDCADDRIDNNDLRVTDLFGFRQKLHEVTSRIEGDILAVYASAGNKKHLAGVGTGSDQARQQRVFWIIFAAPDDRVTGLAARSVREGSAACDGGDQRESKSSSCPDPAGLPTDEIFHAQGSRAKASRSGSASGRTHTRA